MTVNQPSLRRNFSWTFLGNAVLAACLWGLLAVLTKLGSPDVVGRFALGSAIASPVFMFAQLQLRVVLATDAEGAHRFQDYLGVRLLMLPGALLVVAAIAYFGYSREQALVIGMFALVRLVEALSDIFYGFAQKNERMDLVARSLLVRGPAILILFGATFWLTRSLALSLVAYVAALLLAVLLIDGPQLHRLLRETAGGSLRPRWDRRAVREIVTLAAPLGLVMLLITLRNTIPRTFLESTYGEEELGIFSALSYLVIAGSTVIMALSQSSIARLSRYFAEGRRERFQATITKLLGLGVLIGAGGVLLAAVAGGFILELLYSPAYAAHTDLFVVIMIGGALLYLGSLLGAPVSAMREFRVQLWVYLVNVVLLLGLSWLLIPRHGSLGAALVMVGCSVWIVIAYGFIVWRGIRRMGAGDAAGPPPVGGQPT